MTARPEPTSEGAVGRTIQLFLLTLVAMGGIYARSAIGPLQESLRIALSLTDNQIALLQGPALAFPLLMVAVPLGLAIDHHSRVRLLTLATCLNCLATLIPSLSPSFPVLLAARCLVGIGAPATAIAAYSLVSDLYVASRRGRATMAVMLGQVAGSSAAFAVGGELLSSGQANGWRSAMLVMGLILAPVPVLTLAIREPPRSDLIMKTSSLRSVWGDLFRYRQVFAVLVVGMTMANLADGAALVWTVPMLSRRFGLPPDHTGTIMASILLAAGVLGPGIGGTLADVCCRTGGPRRTVSALSALSLISAAASIFSAMDSLGPAVAILTLFLVIGGALSTTTTSVALVAIPNELRGLCVAVKFAAGTVFGLGIAPISVSLLASTLGGPMAIGNALTIVCMATSSVGLIAFIFGRRYFSGAS